MAQDALPKLAPELFTEESMEKAVDRFVIIQDDLENRFMNQYVRIDPNTGDYVVGKTRGEARTKFRARFGERVAWTMHIGTTRER
jgi:hypothetical protein